jgi:hypothetical protein
MDKTKATEILLKKIAEWENKPKTDGYEYEKSFIEVMRGLETELLQLSVGDLPKDRNEKKSNDTFGRNRSKKDTSVMSQIWFSSKPLFTRNSLIFRSE